MKNIFNTLHYTVSNDKSINRALKLIVINNTDGSPRWILPAGSRLPYFLKFYNISGLKSAFFAIFCKLIFRFKLQSIVFKTQLVYLSCKDENPFIDLFQNNWAIFTGTPGPNNKAILYVNTPQRAYFYKIATGLLAQHLLKTEFETTLELQEMQTQNFIFPESKLLQKEILQLTDLSMNGKRNSEFGAMHIDALNEIYSKTANSSTMPSELISSTKQKLSNLLKSDKTKIPYGILRKLTLLEDSLTSEQFVTTNSHGDFTPWNMYELNKMLAIYDWELAQKDMPIGFDAFHFIIQKGILIDRKSWKEIRKEIEQSIEPHFALWDKNLSWKEYLKLYLYINTTNYLQIYNIQQEWHLQVNWLLQTWTDAMSDVVADIQENRKLLINDIFDFLHFKKYAAVKFPNIRPEDLASTSDIDLFIEKNDEKLIINYLKNHPLVSRINRQKKSFMTSMQLTLNDGTILCLDLIYVLKRKAMIMMDIKQVIENSELNKFGIRLMNNNDTANYIGLFNGLNNSLIPEKYQVQMEYLAGNDSKIDALIYSNFKNEQIPQNELFTHIGNMKKNKGFSRLKNNFTYVIDSIRSFFAFDGFVITFSGVDGAGKSTVIEKVKYEIEKKLRKKVVVIRHRPSVLPILSAWTKGKAKAEQDAANSLPRQGKNKSSLGSMLRFMYYYSDYLLGQFIVYLRYTTRGHVVLYDRYYFDFINDSVRSNIQLSPNFVKAGYRFLMKPELNFFLYADSETILKRKQELDKGTIEQLTKKYLTLFNQLNNGGKPRYYPIENIDLDTTISLIMSKSQKNI